MRLTHFDSADANERVVLLDSFTPEEVGVFQQAVASLATDPTTSELRVDELPSVEPVDGCSLTATLGSVDQGITREGASAYRVALTTEGWQRVADLLEPFSHPQAGQRFQYLGEGDAAWIISTDGHW